MNDNKDETTSTKVEEDIQENNDVEEVTGETVTEGQPEEQCEEQAPLAAAQAEVAELQDKLLRQHAEMENLRKRTQREVADARKYAIEKFATSLLDVVDNLERAVETEEGNEAAVREGVALTLDSWHKVASKFELERIDAVGQIFDPHFHEALSKMPSDEPADTVVAQHMAGYTLNGRLIRPAKVLVSSGSA